MGKSKFALVLRMHRENAGLTQKQVADALNIKRSTYSYYELGSSNPSGVTILKLARILNVDYSVLMDAIGDVGYVKQEKQEELSRQIILRDSAVEFPDEEDKNSEKIYSLKKSEKNMIVLYRAFNSEQKTRVDELFNQIVSEILDGNRVGSDPSGSDDIPDK